MTTAFRSFLLIFLCPGADSPHILLRACVQRGAEARYLSILLERAISPRLIPSNKHIKSAAISCWFFSRFGVCYFFLWGQRFCKSPHYLASIFMSAKFDQFPQNWSPSLNTKSTSSCGENLLVTIYMYIVFTLTFVWLASFTPHATSMLIEYTCSFCIWRYLVKWQRKQSVITKTLTEISHSVKLLGNKRLKPVILAFFYCIANK